MPNSFTFNGIKKDWIYLVKGRSKPPFAALARNVLTVPNKPGGYLRSTGVDPLPIAQPIGFKVDNNAVNLSDELASWLITEQPAPLEFDDEPGRFYYALVQNTLSDFEKMAEWRQGTIQFLCLDPFAYGAQQTINFTDDAATLTNEGTAEADPVFTFTANQDLTYLQIANNEGEYNMIGRQQTVDEIIVDPSPNRFEDDMGSLDNWSSTGTVTPEGAVIAGTFASDGALVYAYNYGTGTGWHGPAQRANLPTPIQDYFIEATFALNSFNDGNVGRVELYLIGDDGSIIGKLAMKDILNTDTNNIGEIRIGDMTNGQMLVQGSGYRKGSYNDFYGKLTLRRDNDYFHAQIGEIVDGQMVNRMNGKTRTNDHQTPLAAVQIHIATHGTNNPVDQARIHHVRVSEIVDTAVNEVPVIIHSGDTVAFDHKESSIFINGEKATMHKDFGGRYFSLKPGPNGLYVFPAGATTGSVKYEPRYR